MQQPTPTNKGHLALSQEDVQRLLQDNTSSARIDMTDKIASAFSGNKLDSKETKKAEQIFRLLLRDTEIRVRVALAQHLKDSPIISRDIVKALARDVEEVSLPILQYSEVLDDNDLVELINNTQEISRYLAISRRKEVSDTVTDTLLDKGNDEVTLSLVDNAGASISNQSYEKIIQTHGSNEKMMKAVTSRPHLPVATVEKLVHVVSASLAAQLKQKYQLPAEQIQQEVEKTRESETLNLIRVLHLEDDIDRLVVQLQSSERLTPSIILSSLCQGNSAFFEISLARLSNIPVANARKLIGDKGELGFRAIYNKSGLPDAMFPAVKLLLRVVHELEGQGTKPGSKRFANNVVERILQYSEDQNIENLSYIIALVRRIAQ